MEKNTELVHRILKLEVQLGLRRGEKEDLEFPMAAFCITLSTAKRFPKMCFSSQMISAETIQKF